MGEITPTDKSEDQSMVNAYHGFDTHASEDIQDLAKTFTHHSIGDGTYGLQRYLTNMTEVPGINPYTEDIYTSDQLNPDSDNFNAKFWIKNLRKLYD